MPQLGRLVLVRAALPGPDQHRAAGRPGGRAVLDGADADRPLGGVELYVGGVEHAVLHLLYARFWHKVLFDLGYLSSSEPFHRLVNQGYVQAYAYTQRRGFYVPAAEVDERDGAYFFDGAAGHPRVRQDGQEPEERRHAGRDVRGVRRGHVAAVRDVQPARWSSPAVGHQGGRRLVPAAAAHLAGRASTRRPASLHVSDDAVPDELNRLLHKTIHAVREGYETLRFNTSIARITELNNAITQAYPHGGAPRAVVEPLVLMLAPLAPHIGRGAVVAAGPRRVAGVGAVPGRRRGAAGRRHHRAAGAGERQGARGGHGRRPTPTPTAMEAAARGRRARGGRCWTGARCGASSRCPAGWSTSWSERCPARSASASSPTRRPACPRPSSTSSASRSSRCG